MDTGFDCCGVIVVPGLSKADRCGVILWMRTLASSVIVAVKVVGGLEGSDGGTWWTRIRLVVEHKGIGLVSSIGSAFSSSSSSSSESSSPLSLSILLSPLNFITINSFSCVFLLAA